MRTKTRNERGLQKEEGWARREIEGGVERRKEEV